MVASLRWGAVRACSGTARLEAVQRLAVVQYPPFELVSGIREPYGFVKLGQLGRPDGAGICSGSTRRHRVDSAWWWVADRRRDFLDVLLSVDTEAGIVLRLSPHDAFLYDGPGRALALANRPRLAVGAARVRIAIQPVIRLLLRAALPLFNQAPFAPSERVVPVIGISSEFRARAPGRRRSLPSPGP